MKACAEKAQAFCIFIYYSSISVMLNLTGLWSV